MITRCTNPSFIGWDRYGGRGIKVCERWQKFENFLADMGERPDGTTLDRYPSNDGNYEPGNCRWATDLDQRANASNSINLTYDGMTLTLTQWAERLSIKRDTLLARYTRGDRPPRLFRQLR